jgi:hypothetical protein
MAETALARADAPAADEDAALPVEQRDADAGAIEGLARRHGFRNSRRRSPG